MQTKAFVLLFISLFSADVTGHGRLLDPPGRSSLWRFETTDPALIPYRDIIQPNYDDNGLNCGGRQTQIDNKGMCGVCGDSYSAEVKENEAGGRYALGIITRNYQAGDIMDVTIEITAQHKGYFEFRLCPWNDVNTPVTHECLNQHLLSYENGETKWYLPEDPDAATGSHNLRVRLPADVQCNQCVLQWRYRTGNSWGYENGQQGLGLGQQEEFYACSDVAIAATEIPPPLPSSTTDSLASSSANTESSSDTTASLSPESTTSVETGSKYSSTTNSEAETTVTTTATPASTPILYPKIDCSKVELGLPIFRDCHSFYICAFSQYDPFVFACPPGTVCDPQNGRCDHPYNVPPPCNTM